MAKNILICDDAAFMRMMIKDILTKNGIRMTNGLHHTMGILFLCTMGIT